MKSPTEFCIVLEYADAQDLQAYIASHHNLSEQSILSIFSQIILALCCLHSPDVRVLHRDLKAANVFLFRNGLVKVGDFGISRTLPGDDLARTLIGTPYFVSPEFLGRAEYGFPADIWGAGCILYELMTGRRPFEAPTRDGVFQLIQNADVADLPRTYSPALRQLALDMLNKDPAQRPTAMEIVRRPLLESGLDSIVQEVRGPRREADPPAPEWIRNDEVIREELLRQSFRQLEADAERLVNVVRTSVSRRPAEIVSAGPIQSDIAARRRQLEADARRILGVDKFEIAYEFIRTNYGDNREQLAALLGAENLPPAVKLVDAIAVIDRYE